MSVKIIMDAYDVHKLTKYSIGHCRRILRRIKTEKNKLKHPEGYSRRGFRVPWVISRTHSE